MIAQTIQTGLQHARANGWRKTYWAIDIHGTVLKPTFRRNVLATDFYPDAREVLQGLSCRPDMVLILYTCSYPQELDQYLLCFRENNIHFDYINRNPEIGDGAYGYYQDKFYYNILLDDKAGFDGNTDWTAIQSILQNV